ncbi:MAG: DUF2973 domain-containing protein [Drouetiella hepatica Uher 2000/2452]|jgi:hypothetical protein|uniref:DUF2973 domain-containing protein n=1 Tax=Drouetiella hepatica Uher 2000/2452 TaxID=904376 RepID=A0A951QDE4_9CYAN|nr:DUF2973 domain-containing protein [Drouetiella hepatica Uher 2000/2452]
MLHLIYILAFTILAFLAVGNLIRNLVTLGLESQRPPTTKGSFTPNSEPQPMVRQSRVRAVPHPELLDDHGNVVDEPFLVMRSMTVEDARERLDALYNSSPGQSDESSGEV